MESFGSNAMPSGWLGRFLKFAVIIFIVVVVIYFLLHYLYLGFLDRRIAGVENNIKSLEKEIPAQDREEVSAFYSQLVNLQSLLGQHVYASQIFERLELNTHPQVAFTNFDYDLTENRIKLDGYSQDLKALSEQLLSFQRTSDFDKVNLSNVRQSANKINFTIEVSFKPSLVLKKI